MAKDAKLQWYYNRLKLMSPNEIVHRIYNKTYSCIERFNRNKMLNTSVNLIKNNNFYQDKEDLKAIKEYYKNNLAEKVSLLTEAEKLLEHKFTFFSFKDEYFGESIDWHKDYSTGKRCEPIYYSDIDYRDYEKLGDIKYIWELSRFQHLLPLAQAFCLTSENKYAVEILSQIDDWIDKNPYLMGANWTSSLESALRIISWSWALNLLKAEKFNISKELEDKVLKSIYLQADYIKNHLSAHSSANNHLIGEAAGLVYAGTLYDFGKESKEWQSTGAKILEAEISNQIFKDGLNREQTLAYHCFVFDFFFSSFLLLERNNYYVSPSIWQKLELMAEALACFADNKLNIPNIGDADDGYVFKFQENNPVRSILNLSAIVSNRGDFKHLAGEALDIKTIWLLGKRAFNEYKNIEAIEPDKKSTFLHDSGYVILKDSNISGVIDVGKLGYLSIAAHGHADALSFCLNYKNTDFFIDPGTYAYHTKKEWRDYFRGTSAHNTLVINDLNQSEIGGNFMWHKKADVDIHGVRLTDDYDYINASHDGYIKQSIAARHARELFFKKGRFIIIVDRVRNYDNQQHNYALNWHLAETCDAAIANEMVSIENNSHKLYMKYFCEQEPCVDILNGSLSPISGWISNKFDTKMPTNTIRVQATSDKDIKFITLISFDTPLNAHYDSENLIIKVFNESYRFAITDNHLMQK